MSKMIDSYNDILAREPRIWAGVKTVRKARRAAIGLAVSGVDIAIKRVEILRKNTDIKIDDLAKKGELAEANVSRHIKELPEKLQNTYLGVLSLSPKKPSAKSKAKNKSSKQTKSKTGVNQAKYIKNVLRYDAKADEKTIRKIISHLGIALRSKDGSLVACSDKAELELVREKWLKKKLGLKGSNKVLDKKIAKICEIMKKDKNKCRVTFYYLLAKNSGVLSKI